MDEHRSKGAANMKSPSVLELASYWEACLTVCYGISPQGLTRKQLGQLKYLRDVADDEAMGILGWTAQSWPAFATRAQADAGLSSAPPMPDIEFLVRHCSTAMNMMLGVVPAQVPKRSVKTDRHMKEAKATNG
jgi:hypothetical protein